MCPLPRDGLLGVSPALQKQNLKRRNVPVQALQEDKVGRSIGAKSLGEISPGWRGYGAEPPLFLFATVSCC